jgi:hypothetical protein
MTLYHAFETLVVPLIVLACAVHVVAATCRARASA